MQVFMWQHANVAGDVHMRSKFCITQVFSLVSFWVYWCEFALFLWFYFSFFSNNVHLMEG